MRPLRLVCLLALLGLAATPADARFGGLLRGVAKGAKAAPTPSPRAAAAAARATSTATHIPIPAAAGIARRASSLPPDARRALAFTLVLQANEAHAARLATTGAGALDDGAALAARAADDTLAVRTHASPARVADDVPPPRSAGEEQSELLQTLLETSADAAGSILDAADAREEDLAPADRASMIHDEWVRHARRVKRIGEIEAHAAGDASLARAVATLRAKEDARHRRMIALLERDLHSDAVPAGEP